MPVRVLAGFTGGALLTLLINLASSDIDAWLVDRFGRGYTMQFVLAGLGWDYWPHVVAIVGIVGVGWWSQGAPEPGSTIATYGLTEPQPPRRDPLRTTWAGVDWEQAGQQVRPFCPEHKQTRLQFSTGRRILQVIPSGGHPGPFWAYCPTGDHLPAFADGPSFFENDYRNAETIAEGRIRALQREKSTQA